MKNLSLKITMRMNQIWTGFQIPIKFMGQKIQIKKAQILLAKNRLMTSMLSGKTLKKCCSNYSPYAYYIYSNDYLHKCLHVFLFILFSAKRKWKPPKSNKSKKAKIVSDSNDNNCHSDLLNNEELALQLLNR